MAGILCSASDSKLPQASLGSINGRYLSNLIPFNSDIHFSFTVLPSQFQWGLTAIPDYCRADLIIKRSLYCSSTVC